MEQQVWVVEEQGREAVVEMRRHSACGSCGACWTGQEPKQFTVLNPKGFKAGQKVKIELPDGGFLRAAFMVYTMPLIGGLLFTGVGSKVAGPLSDGLLCILFVTGVAIVFGLLRLYDNRGTFRESYLPVIVSKVEGHEDEENS